MKIGIDARMYRSEVAGISRYSQNLIKNLLEIDTSDEFVLFMTSADKSEFDKFKIENSLEIVNCKLKIIITDIPHYSIAEQTKLGKIIEKEKLDLMHFLSFNHPVNYNGKFVVTIHDLTLLLFPETARETSFLKRKAFIYVMKDACKKSQIIITDSENTKKDIVKKLKVTNKKIQNIYLAADDKMLKKTSEKVIEDIKTKNQIGDKPVILYVGQMRPHKNIPSLIEAFDILKKEIDAKLVIIGKPDKKHQRFFKTIDNSRNIRDIVMPGFVSNEELSAWYKIATVFCFPSLYEGFGLPGLEAMQAGTPVVSSDTSSLPEIYRDAAIYFDPCNTKDIADKIKEVINNKIIRDDLIKKGKIVSKYYSWKKTAEETLSIYKQIQMSNNK
jgi:glycosyltransferase involved in cell wall biosynthesis